jgi:hypothetical protein
MDKEIGEEVRLLCRHIRLSTFDHQDNAIALLAMAQSKGLIFDELCAYVWIQTYISEPESFLPEYVAQLFDLDLLEFEEYLCERTDEFEMQETSTNVCFLWETEESLLEDLQRDALTQGG